MPVAVALSDMTALSAGNAGVLGQRVSGGVAAWGYNGYGGLGDGTVVDRHSPVDVSSYNRGSGTLYSRGSAPRATYAYDGTGLRSAKTVAGTSKAFVYDFSQGLPLVLSDGDRNYIYGADGQPLEQIDPAGNVSFFHHDQLGSTRALTDSTGAITGSFTYDPYGNLTGRSGTAVTPLGYAGEYTDAQTGFIYLRARYYDPATGQFLSRDPITAITREPYGYANENPLNRRDPRGLCSLNPFSDDDCYSDAVNGVTDVATTVADCVVELCLAHPVEAVGAVVAAATISGLVIWGGVAACATLVGCIAGAPLIIIGAAGVVGTVVLAYDEIDNAELFAPHLELGDGKLTSCASTFGSWN